jgi:hypothetical protein
MSVPRPAMLVEIVTAPLRPAWATISASRSCCLAFRTLCGMPRFLSFFASISDVSMEIVPTRIGWFEAWRSSMSSTTALNFSRFVLKTTSARSSRIIGRLVGTTITSRS